MNYIKTNKATWEDAFTRRKPQWGEDDFDPQNNDRRLPLSFVLLAEKNNNTRYLITKHCAPKARA